MDLLANLGLGFSIAFSVKNLIYCFLGALFGTLIGVLPGVGPLATIALLLPITFHLEPTGALIMLAGIFYGAQYGGSTTAILVNLPGEATSVVTAMDGYQMARQGRAGAALAVAALASFFAGCVSTLVIAFLAPPLSKLALAFGPAEFTALFVLGLIAAVVLASGSFVASIGMVMVGILLGLVGTDVSTGEQRLTMGMRPLFDGIEFIVVAMGVFGIAEIIDNLERRETRQLPDGRISGLWPTRDDARMAWPAALRGTVLGSVLGVLPGGGALVASFASYGLEKRLAKDPSRFGKGAVEGVAGPEAANNAGAQASFIPMFALGIPPNAVMALMIAAMTIHGITPGPKFLADKPTLFWAMVASMWIGNLMLVVLNLPLVGLWVRLLRVPYAYLFPLILTFCCIGVYSVNYRLFDVILMGGFGAVGLVLKRIGCEPAPMVLAFVLGPMLEEQFRRTLLLSDGDFSVFATRPLSAGLLAAAVLLVVLMSFSALRKRRDKAFEG
ncbi:MAG: tripartite tricarboxylate transporter permease [Hyphomicrobiaceae bacterium]|nr:tripartite tricarboxylate transporter permease [Hyphomicrobiaceae bacterium]